MSPCKVCGFQAQKILLDFSATLVALKSSAETGCVAYMLFTNVIAQWWHDIEGEEMDWISKERHLLIKRSNPDDGRIYEIFITPGTSPPQTLFTFSRWTR